VFKTIADPFTGRISLVKLYSGVMKSDTTYNNQTKGKAEKFGPLQVPQGKTMIPIGEVHAGDFFAVTKLRETTTGDTFCDPAHPIVFSSVEVPEPSLPESQKRIRLSNTAAMPRPNSCYCPGPASFTWK
jgi:elongation factor G